MALVQCSEHGITPYKQTCQHVDAEFKSGKYKEFRKLSFWGNLLVCDECWNLHNIARFETNPEIMGKDFFDIEEESSIIQEYSEVYNKLGVRVWCKKCLDELIS